MIVAARRFGFHAARRLAASLTLLAIAAFPVAAQTRIGVTGPFSGPDALFGQQIRDGATQAVADLNASGGLLKQRVTTVLGDDQGNAERSVEIANRFTRDKIAIVIGPFGSSAASAVTSIYGTAGTLEFLPAATAPGLTDNGPETLFRLGSREDRQGSVAARFILARQVTRVTILHDKSNAGKALAESLRVALDAGGLHEPTIEGIDKGARDFGPPINRIKASAAELVFWAGGAADGGALARQLHDSSLKAVFMGGTNLAADEFASLAGAGAEGALVLFPPDPRQRPYAQALVQSLAAKSIEPGTYTFYSYAAVEILRQAAEAAKSAEPTAIARAIRGGQVFRTVLGPLSFDAKGDPLAPDYGLLIWHRRDGRMALEEAGRS